MSFPPAHIHGSNAADLAQYISIQNSWGAADQWYKSSPLLPPMPSDVRREQVRWMGSTSTFRGMCTLNGSIVFPDLSVCYYRIIYPTSSHQPSDSSVQRKAWYTYRPPPMTADALVLAHTTYGEDIASFVEGYEGTGQYVTNGECWSLAHEAIQYTTQRNPGRMPVPSLSRTHGHLIWCGRPGEGRWRGDDSHVRRGDIVEWRTARVESRRGWSILGDPEHTAVIVEDCVPSVAVSNGVSLPPAQLGTLTVVEQSRGSPPKRMSYALNELIAGEVWIYRPVCMREYVGAEFEVEAPPGAPIIEV
ncbi:hypothetical protein K488DRAFT_61489 [Vararia minispora EC-137]|uniref:Uncharacterized protein n=1 Tax=Vararia minispora EC-137 TaxID=1314806 RepID=A0ACB8Q7A1_9AGAM|nr:hypothetical protein K488DRAFT_61489 [Vararia minispora EC-137]